MGGDSNKISLAFDDDRKPKRGRRPNNIQNYANLFNGSDNDFEDSDD